MDEHESKFTKHPRLPIACAHNRPHQQSNANAHGPTVAIPINLTRCFDCSTNCISTNWPFSSANLFSVNLFSVHAAVFNTDSRANSNSFFVANSNSFFVANANSNFQSYSSPNRVTLSSSYNCANSGAFKLANNFSNNGAHSGNYNHRHDTGRQFGFRE